MLGLFVQCCSASDGGASFLSKRQVGPLIVVDSLCFVFSYPVPFTRHQNLAGDLAALNEKVLID